MVIQKRLEFSTRGNGDILDITPQVAQAVAESRVETGVAVLFVVGSTAALTLNENEPGLLADLRALLEGLVPRQGEYRHNLAWAEKNAHAHLRTCLLGFSLSLPVQEGKLLLGTWQQVLLVDWDTRPRSRHLLLHILS